MGYLNTSNKIKGKYRVLAHYDLDTNEFIRDAEGNLDASFDDLYIPCKGDAQIYWFGAMDGNKRSVARTTLVAYLPTASRARNLREILEKEYPDIAKTCYFDIDKFSVEGEIFFDAKYIDVFAELMGAMTKGKDISPFSVKNLPKDDADKLHPYSIGEDYDKELFQKYVSNSGLQLVKAYTDMYANLSVQLGIDIVAKAKEDKYKPLHWLHKNGYWGKVIDYVSNFTKG